MLKSMNFKDFPDPNFYYIWSYEPERIKLKTRDKEGKIETLSISLTSISDEENWKDKKFLLENNSDKDSLEDEIEDEVEDLYDHNMFKMSIFDRIEHMKNRGDIDYEEYTVKSTIARNSKRFKSYDRKRARTSYNGSTTASRTFKRSGKVSSLSRNLTKSFAGSVTNLNNVGNMSAPKFGNFLMMSPNKKSNQKKLSKRPSIVLEHKESLEDDYRTNKWNSNKVQLFQNKNNRSSEKNFLDVNLSVTGSK